MEDPIPLGPQIPAGLNHVVLNVRDIEQSHRFWTEILGFRQVGELRSRPGAPRPTMRFYSGDHDGKLAHHDIALVEQPGTVAFAASGLNASGLNASGLNHVAIAMPDRATWLKQLAFLRQRGIRFAGRFNRGVTRSVHIADPDGHDVEILYELPRARWERDIDAALNHVAVLNPDSDEALTDGPATPVFGAPLLEKL